MAAKEIWIKLREEDAQQSEDRAAQADFLKTIVTPDEQPFLEAEAEADRKNAQAIRRFIEHLRSSCSSQR